MTPLPSLNGLRAFESAARHMSFSKAAEELHVTQTAISHQIRKLEEQLGIRLFVRQVRAVALTREGQDYLPAVAAAFEDLRRATARLARPRERRILTVSALPSLAAKWLVPRLGAFQAAHPGIEVRITTSMHLVEFRREQVDMAIRHGHGQWPGLRADWLMSEDIFPVCSPALLEGPNALRRLEDLARYTLLGTAHNQDEWPLWLTAAGLPVSLIRRSLTFDLSLMAYQAAIDGVGVALGRTPLVEADLAAGRLVIPFGLPQPATAGYYVVSPQASADLPDIALFRSWLLAQATDRAAEHTLPGRLAPGGGAVHAAGP
jgi:LysR family transcriptional regulator, glycine cleavage system transcriptional activator